MDRNTVRRALEDTLSDADIASMLLALTKSRDQRVRLRALESILRIVGADPRASASADDTGPVRLNLRSALSGVLPEVDLSAADAAERRKPRRTG